MIVYQRGLEFRTEYCEVKMNLNKVYTAKTERWKVTLLCTFLWGFLAHGFAFANLNLSHDSLAEFYLPESAVIKFQLGRFSEPLIRFLMGEFITQPWLTGIVSLVFLFGAAYLTMELFELSSLLEIVLLTGIFTTNLTVTACIATYAHDVAGDMAALFLSVLTVSLWKKNCMAFSWGCFVGGIVSTAFLLGSYQSYFSVSIVLIMIASVMQMLNGQKADKTFRDGLWGIAILALGFGLYLVLVKCACLISGVPLIENDYNSLSNLWMGNRSIPRKVLSTYAHVVWTFLGPTYTKFASAVFPDVFYPTLDKTGLYLKVIANLGLLILTGAILIRVLFSRKLGRAEKLLTVVLVIAMPFAMDISYVGSETNHVLMHFAFWLVYLFAGLLIRWRESQNAGCTRRGKIACALALVILIHNVQTANAVYVKKELEDEATLSTMTRVLSAVEAQESYVYGQTPVAFIGTISAHKGIPGTEQISTVTGVDGKSSITYQETYRAYFDSVLQYDICLCSQDELDRLHDSEEVQAMAVFPDHGSVKTMDGVIVVKMG